MQGDREAVVSFISNRDVACPVCRYNVRGVPEATCPECAAELRLELGSERLRIGPWLVGVIAFALGLGFDGVVGLIMAGSLVVFPPPSPLALRQMALVDVLFLAVAGVCAAGLVQMYRQRSRWNRQSARRQNILAAVTFFGVGGAHAAFGAWVVAFLN
ncbi:MAG: hypothetical protein ACKVW3_04340 [Phycisphaerales bacterium]